MSEIAPDNTKYRASSLMAPYFWPIGRVMRRGDSEGEQDGGDAQHSLNEHASAVEDASGLLEQLGDVNASIESKAELSKLEPVLDGLAAHLGAEALMLAELLGDSLIQRTHLFDDRLTGFTENMAALAGVNSYEWSPEERVGQAAAFPDAQYGRVFAVSGRRQQERGEVSATLTLITGDRPFNPEHAELISWVGMILSGLLQRLDRELAQARTDELSRLRLVGSSRLHPYADAGIDAVQAVTDVLAVIAEGFQADEVIWGNRPQPETQHSSQRYIRSTGQSCALPASRLLVEGGLDAATEDGVLITRFSDKAHHALGHDPDEMSSSVTWITPIHAGPTVIGGLALLFYAAPGSITDDEKRFLSDISNLLQQYEVRMRVQRNLDKRHRYDELSIRVAQKLLDAAHDADSTTEAVEWALAELCQIFGADHGTREVDGDEASSFEYDSPSGRRRNQKLLELAGHPFIRSKVRRGLETNVSVIVSYADFSEDERKILDSAGLSGVTAMATRLTHKNRVTTCGVLSWEPRPWDEAELSAMQSISSLLHQSLDAIEMRRAVSVADEMERLTTRVSAALTHQTSLPDALDQVLADIARTIGGSGAAWVEFTPNAHRYDLLGGHRLDGTPYPVGSTRLDDAAWQKVYDFDWTPGFYTPEDPPMDTVTNLKSDIESVDRILLPVLRDERVVSVLDIQVHDGPRPATTMNTLSTIAEIIHEAVERARMARLFATTFDSAPTGQLVLDELGVVQAINNAAEKLGIIEVGQRWSDVDPTFSADRGEFEFEVELDRHTRWLRIRSSMITDDDIRPITVVNVEDISAQRAAQAALEHDATHDQLTGLGNRRLLNDLLGRAVAEHGATVIMVDVDRFKSINDSLGHQAGDGVLIALADRLRTTVRDGDLVCRFGGDEFAILVSGQHGRHELSGFASRLLDVLRRRLDVDGHTVIPSCSLGIASIRPREDPETVLRYADAALVTAKEAGRNGYAFFDPTATDSLRDRLDLEMGIRNGLEHGEFTAWFQPEYDLRDGHVTGLEALIRWSRPGTGLVPACDFIDIAEEIGAAATMSELALEHGVALASSWGGRSHRPKIRINITAAQLHDDHLELEVLRTLARHKLGPEVLCLEVTERSLLIDVDQATRTLSRIRGHGIEVAVDDFGTGFSSLAWLKSLPIDTIKIDQSFVQGLATEHADREIVRTVVNLAKALDLDVVAEGVEQPEQVEVLRDIGCHRAQGWLWSPAVEADSITTLINKRVTMP